MSTATITVIERAKIEQINRAHHAVEKAYGDALTHATDCGLMLEAVKSDLTHGQWLPWLEENFEGSVRTAQTYMQLAREIGGGGKAQATAHSTIEAALQQITKPRPKRATAGDAGALLQGLAGGTGAALEPARIDQARDRLRSQAQGAWTDPERRKATRAGGMLTDAQAKLEDVQSANLSRFSIGETLKAAANDTRKAAALLEELAFSFER